MGEHGTHAWLPRLRDARTRVVSITPVKDDTADLLGAEWLAPRPNSDVALMLGIAHTLVVESLHDEAFLESHCVGFEYSAATCWALTTAWRRARIGPRRSPSFLGNGSSRSRVRWRAVAP